ncbi:MAG: GntR family transcriptional regulator [Acidimicrobiia bacterium]|nr:GntR family transcriptional regulator [Acidimicrobiia bacterium]MBP8181434.1 GntR family transcriptional regulator [Acidimicrobiia bacterium]
MNRPTTQVDEPTITVDVDDPTPPYEQMRRQVTTLITAGILNPGDRLPPVRQLANDLGLAAGTVARTYRELEAAGWIHTRRGGGTKVKDNPPIGIPQPESALDRLANEYVHKARSSGAEDSTILSAVAAALGSRPDPA